jgi:hypothetical protein
LPQRWTMEEVLAKAPDAKVAGAARRLASSPVWSELGATDSLVWGRCQGSGRDPYQVTVDLTGPAFRCTCPSFKQPCKHAVALLVMWAQGEGTVAPLPAPAGFAADWAAGRAKGSAGPRGGATAGATVADPEAQAKRRAERIERMTAGLDDLDRWMGDLVRQGLAVARRQPFRYWDDAAARLHDAQLPGLGDRVRAVGGDIHGRADWADHLLAELGRWHLAVRAWERRDHLGPDTFADLRVLLGWARRGDEPLTGAPVADRWHVVGRRLGGDERVQAQRTWIVGADTGEVAVLWDFAAAGAVLQAAHVVGTVVDGAVLLHPGSAPRRASFVADPRSGPFADPAAQPDAAPGDVDDPFDGARIGDAPPVAARADAIPGVVGIAAALDGAATVLAANPWADRAPLALAGVVPVLADGTLHIVGGDGLALPVAVEEPWSLLAESAGRAVDCFGEWEDGRFHVLSLVTDDGLVGL